MSADLVNKLEKKGWAMRYLLHCFAVFETTNLPDIKFLV